MKDKTLRNKDAKNMGEEFKHRDTEAQRGVKYHEFKICTNSVISVLFFTAEAQRAQGKTKHKASKTLSGRKI